ncbi:hypothetical protein [Thermococcus atlanticus]
MIDHGTLRRGELFSGLPQEGAEIYRRLQSLNIAPTRVQHVYKYLETLVKAGFVRSSEGMYWIEDPRGTPPPSQVLS